MLFRGAINRYFTMYYSKSHEYINFNEASGIGVVGISDTAQQLLGDIVYLELPEVG
jgi:glycine cleavage system H protein